MQTLYAASLSLDALRDGDRASDPHRTEGLGVVAAMVRDACEELRGAVSGGLESSDESFDEHLHRRLSALTSPSGAHLELVVEVQFGASTDEAGLHSGLAHDLVSVAREAVSNAVRHGAATTVDVTMSRHIDPHGCAWLRLSVCDDGSGMRCAPTRTGGLSNMDERARRWNGRCEVGESVEGGGAVLWEVPADAGGG